MRRSNRSSAGRARGSGSCLPGLEVRQVASLIVHVDDLLVTLLVELAQLAPGLGVDGLSKYEWKPFQAMVALRDKPARSSAALARSDSL
jgi:hypothetical protein